MNPENNCGPETSFEPILQKLGMSSPPLDRLSNEVITMIAAYLSHPDKYSFIRCSRRLYRCGIEQLYREVDVELFAKEVDGQWITHVEPKCLSWISDATLSHVKSVSFRRIGRRNRELESDPDSWESNPNALLVTTFSISVTPILQRLIQNNISKLDFRPKLDYRMEILEPLLSRPTLKSLALALPTLQRSPSLKLLKYHFPALRRLHIENITSVHDICIADAMLRAAPDLSHLALYFSFETRWPRTLAVEKMLLAAEELLNKAGIKFQNIISFDLRFDKDWADLRGIRIIDQRSLRELWLHGCGKPAWPDVSSHKLRLTKLHLAIKADNADPFRHLIKHIDQGLRDFTIMVDHGVGVVETIREIKTEAASVALELFRSLNDPSNLRSIAIIEKNNKYHISLNPLLEKKPNVDSFLSGLRLDELCFAQNNVIRTSFLEMAMFYDDFDHIDEDSTAYWYDEPTTFVRDERPKAASRQSKTYSKSRSSI
ncbi:hypothetical protein TWF696_001464 [Orbilia brochopaga]|uniref:F-box domain-containing protein n=1 Tax=Orbilia brochopaga TaxID=3140254 RepID=A0AAV9U8Q8_9PEZI